MCYNMTKNTFPMLLCIYSVVRNFLRHSRSRRSSRFGSVSDEVRVTGQENANTMLASCLVTTTTSAGDLSVAMVQLEPLPVFPAEILDYIVDFLFDDKKALVSCSLASRTFLGASRLHLFRSLTINTIPFNESYNHGTILDALAIVNTDLVRLVQEVHVCGKLRRQGTSEDFNRLWDWRMKQAAAIPSLLQILPSIHTLRLSNMIWPSVPPSFEFSTITALNLEHGVVDAIRLAFLNTVHTFPCLLHLALLSVKFADTWSESDASPSEFLTWSLKSLKLQGSYTQGLLRDMESIASFTSLASLDVSLKIKVDITTVAHLLVSHKHNLESLRIRIERSLLSTTGLCAIATFF